MLLSQLQQTLLKCQTIHWRDVVIDSITADSRKVRPGSLFIAIRGNTVDGHQFLGEAERRGAVAALVEGPDAGMDLPQLVVPDTRLASAILADQFYHHPSAHMKVIGVTGTNGKTTTTHLIDWILQRAGHRAGLLGTIGKRINGVTEDVVNTTPEAVDLQETFREMVDAHCAYAIMEASSHAIELRRVAGTRFRTAVFTNLTQDHLDFHGTMEAYAHAKGKLFAQLGNAYVGNRNTLSYGVVNADDPAGAYMAAQTAMECVTYGIDHVADVQAEDVSMSAQGASFRVRTFRGNADVHLRLPGRFNVYNALAALSVALIEDIPLDVAVQALEAAPGIPGRFERVDAGQPYTIIVDYSHTPDSLSNALSTLREFVRGRIITVVGCGGDRDRAKRPLMAQVAVQLSDVAIFTSDNPRTEDPERILDDMDRGLVGDGAPAPAIEARERITDRRDAIQRALAVAGPDDAVLIAGKGHETYQIIGKTKIHFDDREVARDFVLLNG